MQAINGRFVLTVMYLCASLFSTVKSDFFKGTSPTDSRLLMATRYACVDVRTELTILFIVVMSLRGLSHRSCTCVQRLLFALLHPVSERTRRYGNN
jgi:hypothetical protein